MRWSETELEAYQARRSAKRPRERSEAPPEPKRSKYRNVKTEVDGRVFDSKGEAQRYCELRMMEKAGLIEDLRCQVEYRLDIANPAAGDGKVAAYRADFVYRNTDTGDTVTEDWKGVRTDVYKMKRALMRALHGVEIYETGTRKRAKRPTSAKRSPRRPKRKGRG